MTRRTALSALGSMIASAVLDPERALWVPGQRHISIPKTIVPPPRYWAKLVPFDGSLHYDQYWYAPAGTLRGSAKDQNAMSPAVPCPAGVIDYINGSTPNSSEFLTVNIPATKTGYSDLVIFDRNEPIFRAFHSHIAEGETAILTFGADHLSVEYSLPGQRLECISRRIAFGTVLPPVSVVRGLERIEA